VIVEFVVVCVSGKNVGVLTAAICVKVMIVVMFCDLIDPHSLLNADAKVNQITKNR
jgi:hypothetical protein